MSVPIVNHDDVEQARLCLADELAADSGGDWSDAYRPGSPGCHELLDRTALLAAMLEEHVLAHPACVANSNWYALAEQTATSLRELYQQVGEVHLGTESRAEADSM